MAHRRQKPLVLKVATAVELALPSRGRCLLMTRETALLTMPLLQHLLYNLRLERVGQL
jgi:hypothetical protein